MSNLVDPLAEKPEDEDEAAPLPEPFFESEARWPVRLSPGVEMNEEQFAQFCAINHHLRMERLANGDIIMKTPEGAYSGSAHVNLAYQFGTWAERDGTGELFGFDSGFTLPNHAVYAPDIAWVLKSRLRKLPEDDLSGYSHLCPDFVLELRSRSDRLPGLKRKMQEYLENGARLGWLLDPFTRKVFIYRPWREVEELHEPVELSGEDVLKDFKLKVAPAWRTMGSD